MGLADGLLAPAAHLGNFRMDIAAQLVGTLGSTPNCNDAQHIANHLKKCPCYKETRSGRRARPSLTLPRCHQAT